VTDVYSRVVARFGLNRLIAAGVAVVLFLVVAGYFVWDASRPATYTITARFSHTPGLYEDNDVDILGVPTGHVTSVKAKAGYVEVKLSLPASVKLPAGVKAVVTIPAPVSVWAVELLPAYTSGPVFRHGGTIGLDRTAVPLGIDDVFQSVDTFAKDLGPEGANKNGALSDVLHAFAQLVNGGGADVHNAITKIAAALPALTANPKDLATLLTGLDQLTTTLAQHNSTIDSLYDDLTTVTSEFADERQTIAAAIANLQQGLAEVAQFIKANEKHIDSSVRNLSDTVAAIMSEQKALIQTFDVAALGFENFNRSITTTGDCPTGTGKPRTCTGAFVRLDMTPQASSILRQYCGNPSNSIFPIFAYNSPVTVVVRKGDAMDTLCAAAAGLLQNRTGSPNAPSAPDLDLSHYVGS
jgi:virulence factor Mce-like protein